MTMMKILRLMRLMVPPWSMMTMMLKLRIKRTVLHPRRKTSARKTRKSDYVRVLFLVLVNFLKCI